MLKKISEKYLTFSEKSAILYIELRKKDIFNKRPMSSNRNFPLFAIGTHWLPHFLSSNARE